MLPKYALFLPCQVNQLTWKLPKYASNFAQFFRTGASAPTPVSFAFRADYRTTNGIIKKVTAKLTYWPRIGIMDKEEKMLYDGDKYRKNTAQTSLAETMPCDDMIWRRVQKSPKN